MAQTQCLSQIYWQRQKDSNPQERFWRQCHIKRTVTKFHTVEPFVALGLLNLMPFDDLCHKIVTDLKEKHPHIKRIYVRSAFQHIPDWYEDSLLNHYEGTYFPEHMENAGRASYVERNQEMINHSKFCVVYYDENYLPPRRKNSRRDLFDYQLKSGTKVTYDYAVKKKKHIINTLII